MKFKINNFCKLNLKVNFLSTLIFSIILVAAILFLWSFKNTIQYLLLFSEKQKKKQKRKETNPLLLMLLWFYLLTY